MPTTTIPEQTVHMAEYSHDDLIAAPIEVVFQAVLDVLGPEGQMPDGTPFPIKLEPWPGGRWYRDLGNNTGHLWGHVQVIKPPRLLELCGPMYMSYAATNHLQYRLTPEDNGTRLKLRHNAIGLIPKDDRDNMAMGWDHWVKRIRELAARRLSASGKEKEAQR
jgi:uncharacterized protein YndB with AHSA1/START domain